MGGRFQGGTHRGEAVLVGGEPGGREPSLRAGRGDPEHLVKLVHRAVRGVEQAGIAGSACTPIADAAPGAPGEAGGVQSARSDALDPPLEVDPHIAFAQHPGECGAHSGGLVRQHFRAAREQLEAQSIGVTLGRAQPGAQSVPHREHHLHAAGPRPDHSDPHRSLGGQYPLDECIPAGDEVADRLDRDNHAVGSGHVAGERRRADVDGEHVVGHRRAVAADDRAGRSGRVRRPRRDRNVRSRSAPVDPDRCGSRRGCSVRRCARGASRSTVSPRHGR